MHDAIRKYMILPTHPVTVVLESVFMNAAYVVFPAGLVNMFPPYIRKDYPKMSMTRAEENAFQDDPKHRQMAGALLAEIRPILVGINSAFSQVTEHAVLFPVQNLLYEREQAQREQLQHEYEQLQQDHDAMDRTPRQQVQPAYLQQEEVDHELLLDEDDWKVMGQDGRQEAGEQEPEAGQEPEDVQEAGEQEPEAGQEAGDINKRTGCTMQFWFDDDAVVMCR